MSRRRRILRRIAIIGTWLLGLVALTLGAFAILLYSVSHVPSPDQLATKQLATLTYSDGSTMATLGPEDRVIVPLSKVPVGVRYAVIAAEDRGFYSEPGISIRGTVRAAWNDVRGGSTQGGSTITQQYVKNAYLNSDQSLGRKLKELAISVKLSREYSKDTILEYYLNTIYFGRGAYGIQAASQAYFGVDVDKLSVAQGAVLAAVIKSPSYYDPRVTPDAARDRWHYVIDGMLTIGQLTPAQHDALTVPPTIVAHARSSVLDGPLGMVQRQVSAELKANGIAEDEWYSDGLKIQTTIDRRAQTAAENAVTAQFSDLTTQQKQQGIRPALTAVRPADGAVLAYYGGSKGADFDYANGYRPPGSSFKPYTLATVLTQNLQGTKPAYAINSVYNGSDCVMIQGTQVCNDRSDKQYSSSRVRIDFAMKVSLNTVFDGLANEVGPSKVADMAHAAGIRDTDNNGKRTLVNAAGDTTFGIGIGDADYRVRPLDQAVGYATIANGGTAHQAYFVTKVTDSKGAVVYQHRPDGIRAMDPRVANDVGLTLRPVAAWSEDALAGGRQSGAKTGTAGIDVAPGVPAASVGQNSDAWMVGYTPQVSTAVWVGTAGSGPISDRFGGQEYGRDLPGQTWKLFMDAYLAGQPNLPLPDTQSIFSSNAGGPAAGVSTAAPSTPATSTSVPATSAPATSGRATPAPVSSRPASTAPRTSPPATTGPATTGPATTGPVASVPASTVPAATVPAATVPAAAVASATPAPGVSAATAAGGD